MEGAAGSYGVTVPAAAGMPAPPWTSVAPASVDAPDPAVSCGGQAETGGGQIPDMDPRFDLGLYSVPEAARLARVPSRTLWNWVRGYRYVVAGRPTRAGPVLTPTAQDGAVTLSFVNLTEALALSGFRELGVPMQRVRRALHYVGREMQVEHPLATQRILSDGVELFWEYQERRRDEIVLVNIVRGGQRVFPEAVMRYLREIEWGRDTFASRWWPGAGEPGAGPVVVDPLRAFGSPVLAGTGIRTEDVFLRFAAGEPLADVAQDYGLTFEQAEAAIRAEARFLEPLAA